VEPDLGTDYSGTWLFERGRDSSKNFITDSDGLYHLRVSVMDAAGNETVSENADFIIDNTAPGIVVTKNWHDDFGNTTTVNSKSTQFGFDYSSLSPVSINDFQTDHLQIVLYPVDNLNNILQRDSIVQYAVVTMKDELTYDGNGNATGTDPDGKPDPCIFRMPLDKSNQEKFVPDGRYRVSVTAFDKVGNSDYVEELSERNGNPLILVIDREAPAVYEYSVSPALLQDGDSEVAISFKISEPHDNIYNTMVRLKKNFVLENAIMDKDSESEIKLPTLSISPDESGITQVDFSSVSLPNGIEPGRHTIIISVVDNVGNRGSAELVFFYRTLGTYISSPSNGDLIYNKTVIRGAINDPDEYNSAAFEKYELNLLNAADSSESGAALCPSGGTQSVQKVPLNGIVGYIDPAGLDSGNYILQVKIYESGISEPFIISREIVINSEYTLPGGAVLDPDIELNASATYNGSGGQYNFSYSLSGAVSDVRAEIVGQNGVVYQKTHVAVVPLSGVPSDEISSTASVSIGLLADSIWRLKWSNSLDIRFSTPGDVLSSEDLISSDPNVLIFDEDGELVIRSSVYSASGYTIDIPDSIFRHKELVLSVKSGNINIPSSSIKISSAGVSAPANPFKLRQNNTFVWDGTDLRNGVVDNGMYSIVLTATGVNGNGFDRETQELSVSIMPKLAIWRDTPDNCTGVSCSHIEPDVVFCPIQSGVPVLFHVNKNCDAYIKVVKVDDGENKIIKEDTLRSISTGRLQAARYYWDGRLDGGQIMSSQDHVQFEISVHREESGEDAGPLVVPVTYSMPYSSTPDGTDPFRITGGRLGTIADKDHASQTFQVASGDDSVYIKTDFAGKVYKPITVGYKFRVRHKNSVTLTSNVRYVTNIKIRGLVELYPTESYYEPKRTGCRGYTVEELPGKLLNGPWLPLLDYSVYGVDRYDNYTGPCNDDYKAWIRSDYRYYPSFAYFGYPDSWYMRWLGTHQKGGALEGEFSLLPSMTDDRIPFLYINVTHHEHERSGLAKFEYLSDANSSWYKAHFGVEGKGWGSGEFGFRPHTIYYREYNSLQRQNIVPEEDSANHRMDMLGLQWNDPSYEIKTYLCNKYPPFESCLPYPDGNGFVNNFDQYYNKMIPGGDWDATGSYTLTGTDPESTGNDYADSDALQLRLGVTPKLIFSNGRYLELEEIVSRCNNSDGMPYNHNQVRDSYFVYEWILKPTSLGGHITGGTATLIKEFMAKDCKLLGTIGTNKHFAYKIVDSDVAYPGHTITEYEFLNTGDFKTASIDLSQDNPVYSSLVIIPPVPVDPSDDDVEFIPLVLCEDGTFMDRSVTAELFTIERTGDRTFTLHVNETKAAELGFITDWNPADPLVDALLAKGKGSLNYSVAAPEKIGFWPDVFYREKYVEQAALNGFNGASAGSFPLFLNEGSRNPSILIHSISSVAKYMNGEENMHVTVHDSRLKLYENSWLSISQTNDNIDKNIIAIDVLSNLEPTLHYVAIEAVVDGSRIKICDDVTNSRDIPRTYWDAGVNGGEIHLLLSYYDLSDGVRVNEKTYGKTIYIGYIIGENAYGTGVANRVTRSTYRHAEIVYDGQVWHAHGLPVTIAAGERSDIDFKLSEKEFRRIEKGKNIKITFNTFSNSSGNASAALTGLKEDDTWQQISLIENFTISTPGSVESKELNFEITSDNLGSFRSLGIQVSGLSSDYLNISNLTAKLTQENVVGEQTVSSVHPLRSDNIFTKGFSPSFGVSENSPIISVRPSPVTFENNNRPTLYYRILPGQVRAAGLTRENMMRIYHIDNRSGALTDITTGYARALSWDGSVVFDENAVDFNSRLAKNDWDYLELVAIPSSFSNFIPMIQVNTILDRVEFEESSKIDGDTLRIKGKFIPYSGSSDSSAYVTADACSLIINFDQDLADRSLSNIRGKPGNIIRTFTVDNAEKSFEFNDIPIGSNLKNGDSVFVYAFPYSNSIGENANISVAYTALRKKTGNLGYSLVPVNKYISTVNSEALYELHLVEQSGQVMINRFDKTGNLIANDIYDPQQNGNLIEIRMSGPYRMYEEGHYPFQVIFVDGAGSICRDCRSNGEFIVDYTPPEMHSLSLVPLSDPGRYALKISASDNELLSTIDVTITDKNGNVIISRQYVVGGNQCDRMFELSDDSLSITGELKADVIFTDAAGNTSNYSCQLEIRDNSRIPMTIEVKDAAYSEPNITKPQIRIRNCSETDAIEGYKVKIWFSRAEMMSQNLNAELYYSEPAGVNVSVSDNYPNTALVSVDIQYPRSYSLQPGEQTSDLGLQLGVHFSGYYPGMWQKDNDWSMAKVGQNWTNTDHITVYDKNGTLVYGTEPDMTPQPTNPTIPGSVILPCDQADEWSLSVGSFERDEENKTQGDASIKINSSGYQELLSRDIDVSGLGTISSRLAFDFFCGTNQPNSYWVGNINVYVSCPSANLYDLPVGYINLTEEPLGMFKTYTFNLTEEVFNLFSSGKKDIKLKIALNTNSGSGPYNLDNLRFVVE